MTTQTVDRSVLTSLLRDFQPPCISIYQPTHRHYPGNEQDPIRYKHLLKSVESSLGKAYPQRKTGEFLQPFHELEHDANFWNHTTDGMGVLGSPGHSGL